MKKKALSVYTLAFYGLMAYFMGGFLVFAASITFQWEQPGLEVGNQDFYGWKIWQGTKAGGPYTQLGADLVWDGTAKQTIETKQTITAPAGVETQYFYVVDAWNKPGKSTPQNSGYSNEVSAIIDMKPPSVPALTHTLPATTQASTIVLQGVKEANSSIWINGTEKIPLNATTTWTVELPMVLGANNFSVTSKDSPPYLNESTALVVSMTRLPVASQPNVPVTLKMTITIN